MQTTLTRSAPGGLDFPSLPQSIIPGLPRGGPSDPRISLFFSLAPDQPGYSPSHLSVYLYLINSQPSGAHRLDSKGLDRAMGHPNRTTRWRWLSWLKKNGWIEAVRGLNQHDLPTILVNSMGFDISFVTPSNTSLTVSENLAVTSYATAYHLYATPDFSHATADSLNATPDAKLNSVWQSQSYLPQGAVASVQHQPESKHPEIEKSAVAFGGDKGGARTQARVYPLAGGGPAFRESPEEKISESAAAAGVPSQEGLSKGSSASESEPAWAESPAAAAAQEFFLPSTEKISSQPTGEKSKARAGATDDTPIIKHPANWSGRVDDPLHPAYYKPEERKPGSGDNRLRLACLAYMAKHPDHYTPSTYKAFLIHWTALVEDPQTKRFAELWTTQRQGFDLYRRLSNWVEVGTGKRQGRRGYY